MIEGGRQLVINEFLGIAGEQGLSETQLKLLNQAIGRGSAEELVDGLATWHPNGFNREKLLESVTVKRALNGQSKIIAILKILIEIQ